jgi:signal transduction histidine kinase
LIWWQMGVSSMARTADQIGYYGSLLGLGAGSGLIIIRPLWLLFSRQSSLRQRRQIIFVISGYLCTMPLVLATIVPALPINQDTYYRFFWSGLDLRYLLLATPLAFAFVILRYQTFRTAPPIFIAVFILASSALLSSFGAWSLRLGQLRPADYAVSPFLIMLAVTIIASVFWSMQGSWRGVFGRLLHWEKRSYTAVKQFGQRVINQTDLTTLPQIISTALNSELELEETAIWLWQPETGTFNLVSQAGHWTRPPPQQLVISDHESPKLRHPLRLHPHAILPDWLQSLASLGNIEVIVPLSISNDYIGLLALGKRWDQEIFDERDMEIVELIAQQATLFLLAAIQVNELRQVPRQVAEAQERERYKIAQELHDTIQQFLGRLPFYLEVSRAAVWTEPAETDQLLQRSINDVEQAAQIVRQIRHNLAPSQLEQGLVRPLKGLIARFQQRTEIFTNLTVSPDLDNYVSLEARHALYRVVQQALDNVDAHAEADQVEISIAQADGKIEFIIADNGRGISPTARQQAQELGSFGLRSMQARINAIGGEFSIQSTPGQGTRISGRLPIHN